MENPLLNISLRYLIPLLLGVFVLASQTFVYTLNKSRAVSNIQDEMTRDVRNQLNRTQGVIQLLNKDASLLQVRTLVSSFGADIGHELMLLTDGDGIVLASTSVRLQGKKVQLPFSPRDIQAITAVKSSGGIDVFLSQNGHKVSGYASVCARSENRNLRLNNCGLLYLRNDITSAQIAASDNLDKDVLQEIIGLFILGLILWLIIHFQLTRRTQNLVATTQKFANGDGNARTNLEGRDELAMVAGSIDKMLDQIIEERNALESSEDRLRKVFESVADGIITYDSHGCIQAYNSACEMMFMRHRKNVVGEPMVDLITPLKRSAFLSSIPENGVFETIGVRRDGSEFNIEMRLSEMSVKDDVQTIAIIRDVTERKRLEAMQSEFISVVSHELRTPITSIQGGLDLMMGGVLGEFSEKATQMIELCKRNSNRLLLLVNDILDMDKIASGKMEFVFTRLSAMDILQEALEINQNYAQAHGVIFRMAQSTPLTLLADNRRIQQVLSNFLSNAAKFSPAQDVITLSAVDKEGAIRFSVTDHGLGISQHDCTKVFDRFTQIEDANTRKSDGTGLGLSISKSIVECHKGKIGVESTLGQGSTFWFELPTSETNTVSVLGPF